MKLPKGTLVVHTPEGRWSRSAATRPGPHAEIILKNWNLPRRAFIGRQPSAVAESYMDGDWERPDVTAFLELFVVNEDAGEKVAGGANWLLTVVERVRHWLNDNTPSGSRPNISAHLNLGNAFLLGVDSTRSMTFPLGSLRQRRPTISKAAARPPNTGALAQDHRHRAWDHVLEIGCGRGGFAEFAAAGDFGCKGHRPQPSRPRSSMISPASDPEAVPLARIKVDNQVSGLPGRAGR